MKQRRVIKKAAAEKIRGGFCIRCREEEIPSLAGLAATYSRAS
jgi:hypothetical protein